MSHTEHNDRAEWKFEEQRKEREERLAAQKSGEGKKPLKEKKRPLRFLFPVIAGLLVLAILVWGVFSLGLPQKYMHPIEVGSRPVSVVEYNYFYNTAYQQYNQYVRQGMLPGNTRGELDMNALTRLPGKENLTWGELIDEITQEQIMRVEMLNAKAEEQKMTLNDSMKEKLEKQLEEAIKNYGSKLKAENALVKSFGRGMTIENFQMILGKIYLAQQFINEYPKTLEVSEEEIKSYYDEHPEQFDLVDYHSFTLGLPAPEMKDGKPVEQSATEQKDALAKLKVTAEQFKSEITDEASFAKLAKKYAREEDKAQYEAADATLQRGAGQAILGRNPSGQWLLDKARKAGDVEIQETGRSVQIVYFVRRYRPEELQPTIGKLVFQLNAAPEKQDAQALEAQKKAEDALQEKANQSLEAVHDQDSLQAEAARLQGEGENVFPVWTEDQALATLTAAEREWVQDAWRESGDKVVLHIPNGYEILLFSEAGKKPAWHVAAEKTLRGEKMGELLKNWEKDEAFKVKVNSFAMRFTDKRDKNTITGSELIEKSIAAEKKEPIDSAQKPVTEDASKSSEPAGTQGK